LGGKKDIRVVKDAVPLIPKGSLLEQVQEEHWVDHLSQVHLMAVEWKRSSFLAP